MKGGREVRLGKAESHLLLLREGKTGGGKLREEMRRRRQEGKNWQ